MSEYTEEYVIGDFQFNDKALYSDIYNYPQNFIDNVVSISGVVDFVDAFLRKLDVKPPVNINGRAGRIFYTEECEYRSLGYGVVINKTIMERLDFKSFAPYYETLVKMPCIIHNHNSDECSLSCAVIVGFMNFFVKPYVE